MKKRKPLSPRRRREFRDRRLKKLFGDRGMRAARWAWLNRQGVTDADLRRIARTGK